MAGVTSLLEPGKLEDFTQRKTGSKDSLRLLAVSEVTTENLVIASKYQLFIIRLTESQLSPCDCQREGQTGRQREGHRKEGCFVPPHEGFLPFGKEQVSWWLR